MSTICCFIASGPPAQAGLRGEGESPGRGRWTQSRQAVPDQAGQGYQVMSHHQKIVIQAVLWIQIH